LGVNRRRSGGGSRRLLASADLIARRTLRRRFCWHIPRTRRRSRRRRRLRVGISRLFASRALIARRILRRRFCRRLRTRLFRRGRLVLRCFIGRRRFRLFLLRRRLAPFHGLTPIHQHPFQIPKRNIRPRQHRRNICQKSNTIIIGKNIRRVIRPHHHIAHRGERDPFRGRRRNRRRLRLFLTRRRARRHHHSANQPRSSSRANHLSPRRESPAHRHPQPATASSRD